MGSACMSLEKTMADDKASGPAVGGGVFGAGGSPERLARRLDFVLRLAAIAGR